MLLIAFLDFHDVVLGYFEESDSSMICYQQRHTSIK
jgi:hypothetical protein